MRDLRARTERASREELAGVVHDAQALAAAVDAAARRRDALRAAITAATERRAHGLAGELAASQRRDWRGHPQLDDTGRAGSPGAAPIAGSLASVVGAERYLARLRHELELAEDAHARAVARHRGQLDAIDAARARLVRARAAREVIERHFAAWRAERQRLADRRED